MDKDSHVEKGELLLLSRTGADGDRTHGLERILVLYCPQKRRGRLLAVDGFGSDRMRVRVIRAPLRRTELLGEVDGHEKSEITGVYQIGIHEGRIYLACRIDGPGTNAASPIPEEAYHLAAGDTEHPEEALVEGQVVEFASTPPDKSIARVQSKLRKYAKRRNPKRLFNESAIDHEGAEDRYINFERISAIRDEEFPWETRCYRCDRVYYARHNLLGRQVSCPNCWAGLTVTRVLERISSPPEGTVHAEPPDGDGRVRGTDGDVGEHPASSDRRTVTAYSIRPTARGIIGVLVSRSLGIMLTLVLLAIPAAMLASIIALIRMAIRFGHHWAGLLRSLIE